MKNEVNRALVAKKTKLFKSMNLIRRGSGTRKFLLRNVAILFALLTLGTGNAWASSYYTAFNVTSNDTGKGLVYTPSTANTNTAPTNDSQYGASGAVGQSDDTGGSSKTNSYYAWAKAARGYTFKGWTVSGSTIDNASKAAGAKITVTSNKENDTNTGTATAKWTTDPNAYTVTFGVPVDGSYTVTYSYTTIENNAFTTGGFNFSMTESSTAASGQQTSYKGDAVTVSTDATNFEGWYSNNDWAENHKLSGATSYQFTVSGATSVYAKFTAATKYFGQVNASIAAVPNSMPGGGTIYISDIAGTSGVTFSENAQTAKITSFNSDATPPASVNQTYYLYAKPNDKRYVFRGWYDNATCTGTPLSTNASWEYTFAVSSHAEGSPTTKTVYAAFDFNLYYMEVQAQPATQGLGMVLVSDTKLTSPEYTQYSSESSQFAYAYRLAPTADVYVYAKPKYGYKLSGWYTDAACTVAASVASDGKYTASSTASTDPLNPDTITLYAKFVEDATTVNITYNKPDQTKGEYTASVLDIQEIDDEYVWTFTEVFTSVGKTANTTQAQHKTDVLRLEAACKAGYGVTSWTIAGAAKTTPSHIYETSATAAATYGVTFGDAMPFMVRTNATATTGTQYATLSEALSHVSSGNNITVVQSAYVPAGNYTIPNGVTLLVPYDEAYTLKTTDPGHAYASPTAPSVYVKLTLGKDAHITVQNGGAISASATSQGGQPYGGCVHGKYGQIDMNAGSTITLNSGANLYCWGYITGKGEITAKSGSKVYEDFQIACWRGGSAASSMGPGFFGPSDNETIYKVFPLAQYYIQNIEAKLHLQAGALEYVWTSVSASNAAQRPSSAIPLVGTTSGLFQISSGTLTKWFNATDDRQMYEINGNTALGSISMTVYIEINSSSYVLPLTNNMDVTIKSGTLTCNEKVAVLPGAKITICEGANASFGSSGELYVYDKDEWPNDGASAFNYNNVAFKKVNYTATPITNARTYAKMNDAIMDINGTLTTSSGHFYTTSGKANICSSNGTGKIVYSVAAKANTTTYQATQSGTSITYVPIAITPAQLHNGNEDSYTPTDGAAANDQFIYNKNMEQWMKNPKTITWNANGGTTDATTMAYSEGAFIGELPAAYKEGHTLAGWFTAADGGTPISPTTKVTANATYFAHWTPIQYNITYMDQGKAAFSSTHIDSPNAHPTKHTYGTATTLNDANNKTGYDFGGWHTISNCKAESKVTSLAANGYTKDITLYAKWVPQSYNIIYKDKGDAAFSGTSWESNQPTEHTYGTATTLVNPSKANYTFGGWYTTSACTGSAVVSLGATAYSADITLYAKWNETTHTVTVSAGANGSVSPASVSGVGAATASGNITATPNTGYNFSGWTLPESGVTAASGYTTSSNPIHINATADGKTITANFAVANYNVTYSAPSNGSYTIKVADAVAVSANTTAQYNQTIVLSATPVDGYKFDHWTVTKASSGTVTVTDNQFTMPAEAVTVSATFAINQYDLIVLANNDTYGTVTGSGTYDYGTNVTITATPKSGFKFVEWDDHNTNASRNVTVTADVTYTATFDYDIANYTVKHWQQNIYDDDYTEVVADRQTKLSGTIGAPTNAEAKTYTGFTAQPIEQQTIALENTVVNIYYNRETYLIIWDVKLNGEQEVYKEETLRYGATPSYGEDPTKVQDERWVYSFSGWTPNIAEVTANQTYEGTFNATARTYDVTWNNADGTLIAKEENYYTYGAQPNFKGSTPTYSDDDPDKVYIFRGWKCEETGVEYKKDDVLPGVAGDETYTAVYTQMTAPIDVKNDETKNITTNITTQTTTVHVGGILSVAANKALTTTTFILEASADASGQIMETGTIEADNVYFDLKLNTDARHWRAFGVPWAVDINTNPLVEVDNDGKVVRTLNISRDYEIMYYDGAERAANGPSANCWKYLRRYDEPGQPVGELTPGRGYMIAFGRHVNTVRFVKKSDAPIIFNGSVSVQADGSGTDKGINAVSNPMAYYANMNLAGVGQVHDGGEIGSDGYDPVTISGMDYFVGKTVYVQVETAQTITPTNGISPAVAAAPARRAARATDKKYLTLEDYYTVSITNENGVGNNVYVLPEEDKEDKYVIGHDLAHMGMNTKKAQIWINRYDVNLCLNTTAPINAVAEFPVNLYAPNAGEYTISLASQPDDEYTVYLLRDGLAIWNLSYGPYALTLNNGTIKGYGLRLVKNTPHISTGVDEAVIDAKGETRKVVINDKVFIIRGDQVYSVDGQLVK